MVPICSSYRHLEGRVGRTIHSNLFWTFFSMTSIRSRREEDLQVLLLFVSLCLRRISLLYCLSMSLINLVVTL